MDKDSQASHLGRHVHCPKAASAGKAPRQATHPGSPGVIFLKFPLLAPNDSRFSRHIAAPKAVRCNIS